jgi:hypothetical protein
VTIYALASRLSDHAAWAGSEIRKQTEFLILEKLNPALEAAGSSLEQSLKAQIWPRHCREVLVPNRRYDAFLIESA